MPLKFNPFSGSFDFTGASGGGGSSYLDGEVQNFSALPTANPPAVDSAYLVREAEGTWLINRKPAGIYIRVATTGTRATDWSYAGAFPDVFNDANFLLYDNGDSSKNLAFQLSGITTGTTRTLTVPDASGTLPLLETANTFTQNQTLNGTNSTAPNQTAASGSSLMTRDLVDVRNTALWVPIGGRANNTQADAGNWAFIPWGVNATGGCFLMPVTHKKLAAMYINIAFTSTPVAANFSVDVLLQNSTGNNPASNPTTQSLTGTVSQISGDRYKWVLNAATTLTPPNDDGGAYYASARFFNNSGGSLTTVAGDVQAQGYMLLTP
jgi:hypothetical protein